MAGKIKNTVDTQFTSKGAKKVEKDTESIGRSQTRLGQASASTGRQFSAQASGLGGLVAAYAGAAANVFAITQAFAALQRAAQAETIVQGTKTLALEIGANGSEIIKTVQEITQSQLSLAEASSSINIALSAGFNTKQIEGLTEVSMKASRALGRTLTDAFTRVTRGAAKLEPELLDELGIFTRIDPAVEAYAAKLNVATSSLTKFEKRQAFVNAVIEEGQRKFSSIDTTVPSSQKSIEQLIVALTDLAKTFGQLIANVLTPLADFFSKNLGNALLLFGGVLTLVFGKAFQLIGGFVSNSVKNFEFFANRIAKTAGQAKVSIGEITKSIRESEKFDAKGGVGRFATGDRGANVQLQSDLRGLASGQIKDATEQKRALDRLNTAITNKEISQRLDNKTLKNAQVVSAKYGEALKKQGTAARVATAASLRLSGGITAIGNAAKAVMGPLGILLTAFSALQLLSSALGFDILAKLADVFKGVSDEAKAFAAGAYGAFVFAAGGAKELEKALDSLFGVLSKTDREEALADFKEKYNDTINEIIKSSDRVRSGKFTTIGSFDVSELAGLKALEENNRRIAITERALADARRENNKELVLILSAQLTAFNELGNAQSAVGMIAKELGLNTAVTAELLTKSIEVAGDGSVLFKELGISADFSKKSFADLDESQQKGIISLILFRNTLKSANEAFEAGAASSETLSKKLIGASTERDKLLARPFVDPGQRKELLKLTKQIEDLSETVRGLKAAETVGKALRDTFGGAIKAIDTAFQKGLIGGEGFAKTAQEAGANQAEFLKKTIEIGEVAEKSRKSDSLSLQQIKNKATALKAIVGLSFQSAQAIEKELKAQEKILRVEEGKAKVIALQAKVKETEQELATQQVIQQSMAKTAEASKNIEDAKLKIFDEQTSQIKKISDLQQQITTEANNQLKIAREIANIQAKAGAAGEIASQRRKISGQQDRISSMKEVPNLFSDRQMMEERRKLIVFEGNLQMALIEEKERVAKQEAADARVILAQRKTAFDKELANNLILQERALKRQNIEEEIAKLNDSSRRAAIVDEGLNLQKQKEIEERREAVIKQTAINQVKEITAQEKLFKQRIFNIEAQVAAVNQFGEVTDVFAKAVQAFAKAQSVSVDLIKAPDPLDLRKSLDEMKKTAGDAFTARRANVMNQAGINIGASQAKQSDIGLRAKQNKDDLKLLDDLIELETQLRHDKQDAAQFELITQSAIIRKKLEGLGLEEDKIEEILKSKMAAFEDEKNKVAQIANQRNEALEREQNLMRNLANDISGVLKNQIGGSIQDLFKAIAEGTLTTENFKQGFKDMLGGIMEGIRVKVLERTLIEPMNNFIDEAIGGLFGQEQKGIDQVVLDGGKVPVTMSTVSSTKDLFKELGLDPDEAANEFVGLQGEIKNSSFSLSGLLESFGQKASNVFGGLGDTVSSIFKGLTGSGGGGGMFDFAGKLLGGSTISQASTMSSAASASSFFGGSTSSGLFIASGGQVPGVRGMAAGGSAGASPRDRVPALLEPGEFVMQRKAVNAAGLPAMQQMNAGGMPPISVNINNEGTPQEATSATPNIDVDKIVIDVVTRDLRNNGPIRKSLRGGA